MSCVSSPLLAGREIQPPQFGERERDLKIRFPIWEQGEESPILVSGKPHEKSLNTPTPLQLQRGQKQATRENTNHPHRTSQDNLSTPTCFTGFSVLKNGHRRPQGGERSQHLWN